MSSNFNRKIKILTDFKSKLEMFNLNKNEINKLNKKFPTIKIEFINLNKIKKEYDAEIYWGTRINDKILSKCPNLKWIHFGSVGVDKLSHKNLKNRKILISNSPGINSESVFNLAIFFLIDTTKKFLNKKNLINRLKYEKNFSECKDLDNQKIIVLGYGNIAKKLQKFSRLFNLNMNFLSSRKLKMKNIINKIKLTSSLKNYDTIINLLRFNEKNNNFLTKDLFDKMKKDVNLILIGRLKTINIKDLYNFLRINKKATCYLDALPDIYNEINFQKLRKLDNIFITPHIGGYFKNYWINQISIFENNLKLFIKSKKIKNLIYE